MKNLAERIPWIPELFCDLAVLLREPDADVPCSHTHPLTFPRSHGGRSARGREPDSQSAERADGSRATDPTGQSRQTEQAPKVQSGAENHIWLFGERRAAMALALMASQQSSAVFVGTERAELFAERDAFGRALPGAACMGFLRDIHSPDWSKGLPNPVRAISASFCLSLLDTRAIEAFLREAAGALAPGGVFFWTDFFLPQSLSLLTRYQNEYHRRFAAADAPMAASAAAPNHAPREEECTPGEILRDRNLMLPEKAFQCLLENGFSNIELAAKRMNIAVLAAYT